MTLECTIKGDHFRVGCSEKNGWAVFYFSSASIPYIFEANGGRIPTFPEVCKSCPKGQCYITKEMYDKTLKNSQTQNPTNI